MPQSQLARRINATTTDTSDTVCRHNHCCGQKATTTDELEASCCCDPNSLRTEELEVVSMVVEELEACHSAPEPLMDVMKVTIMVEEEL